MEKEKFLIIDANSVIHRAFHALPPLTTKKGELVNAVYGFILVLFKAVKDFQPNYIAACFDTPSPTFRHQKFKEYKAERPPTKKELIEQIPKIKKVLNGFGVEIFEKEGFEADDIIGTLARQAAKFSIFNFSAQGGPSSGWQFSKKKSLETIIISGDLDTLQLVDSHTSVYVLRKGVKDIVLYDENLVKEKYRGLTAEQLIDFKALRGDPSDNIPGVKGIGEKTAIKLLNEFGSLTNLYQEIETSPAKNFEISGKLKEILLKSKEQAFLSYSLAEIKKDVPIEFALENCRWGEGYYDEKKAVQELKNLDFTSLIEKLPSPPKQSQGLKENLKLW